MEQYLITIREEYDMAIQRGYNPLIDIKHFSIHTPLRIMIQKELFGHTVLGRADNVVMANSRYYMYCWENKKQICEECMKPLHDYSPVYISHILSRGAYPEIAHDPRNSNILCFKHHNQWENSIERKKMRIYKSNMRIIELLLSEYKK